MLTETAADRRTLKTRRIESDLVVVGGGLAGTCCAITAARAGIRVVLVQDRPVLGGNASSEVRLWVLGATSHMGNNNRWAREGGVIDELLVENTFRNPEGNPVLVDALLLEKVVQEPNITLLLNTAVLDLDKDGPDTIRCVRAFCSQNSTMYELHAPLFCDASGDGVVGFLAGAAFRMGAESRDEFGEKWAPRQECHELLGHSIYFYSKDVGRPVRFVPPGFALKDISRIPRYRQFNAREHGCQLWWIEYGGRLDTVHETETIKWELWKVVYGVWDYIKNSGRFPEADTLTLEWVGLIPGKRESRRFEGDYMLTQQDIVEQRRHPDDVSFGGWAIDLHPADGVFSEQPGCSQWHSKGVYPIPYRCLYSRSIRNLFLAGRIISASHIAFGSTRVMATCAHGAQAVGMAAAVCRDLGLLPRDLAREPHLRRLQRDLLRMGQYVPFLRLEGEEDLATHAQVIASSQFQLAELPPSSDSVLLDRPRAMLIPVAAGPMPWVRLWARTTADTSLTVQLRACSRDASFTPDEILSETVVPLPAQPGTGASAKAVSSALAATLVATAPSRVETTPETWQLVTVDFDACVETPRYVMICLMPNPAVVVALSDVRLTGVLALSHRVDRKVSKGAVQTPPPDIGVDSFEFWLPDRRPGGRNLAMQFDPPIAGFGPDNLLRDPERPTTSANAWIARLDDAAPWVELRWLSPRQVGRVVVALDTDLDHPMETVLMGHPERRMPFCVGSFRLLDEHGRLLAQVADNHQTRRLLTFDAVRTRRLRIEFDSHSDLIPVSAFRVRVFPA